MGVPSKKEGKEKEKKKNYTVWYLNPIIIAYKEKQSKKHVDFEFGEVSLAFELKIDIDRKY